MTALAPASLLDDLEPGPPPESPTGDRFDGRLWAILLVLCGTVFLEGLDVSMMGVALPSIRADLDMSTAELAVGRQLVRPRLRRVRPPRWSSRRPPRATPHVPRRARRVHCVLRPRRAGAGRMGVDPRPLRDRGQRRFLTPASLSIITTNFAEGERRNRALLIYGGAGAAGFSLGMVAGGLLTAIGWRWVFFAPVLVASALLVVAVRHVPHDVAPPRDHRRVDVAGAVTLTVGMLLLVLGVVRAPDVAWQLTAATVGASAVLLAAFVVIERRSAAPLVRLGILRSGGPGAGRPRGDALRRLVRRFPVHRRALPPGAARLVGAADRTGPHRRRDRRRDRPDDHPDARAPVRQPARRCSPGHCWRSPPTPRSCRWTWTGRTP